MTVPSSSLALSMNLPNFKYCSPFKAFNLEGILKVMIAVLSLTSYKTSASSSDIVYNSFDTLGEFDKENRDKRWSLYIFFSLSEGRYVEILLWVYFLISGSFTAASHCCDNFWHMKISTNAPQNISQSN